jgi:hypothetical protein
MAELTKSNLSPAMQALYANEGEARNRAIQIQMTSLTPDMYKNFFEITSTYPGMSKDLVMAMVKQGLNVNTPGVNKIVSLDGIAQLKKDQFNVDKIKKTVDKDKGIVGSIYDATLGNVYDVFKGATRAGFAALRLPYDFATTLTRDIAQEKDAGLFVKDLATLGGTNTLFGSLVADVFGGKPGVKTGAGFFIDPQSRVGKAQAKAMSAYGKVNGESFTIGRFVAKSVESNPNKTGYKVLSGLVDASLNLALDPSMWFGAGAATAILKGGKKAAALKAEAKEFSPVAKAQETTKEIETLAKQLEEEVGKYTKRNSSKWLRKTKELQRLEKQRYETMAPAITKLLNTQEDSFKAFSQDSLAQEVLSGENLVREIIANKNTYDGELVRGIDRLSAEADNTVGLTDGYIVLNDLPKRGTISFGAHRTDEYVVTLAGDEELKVLDLAQDMRTLTGKEKQAEVNRRLQFEEWMEAGKADANLPPEVRAVLQEISTKNTNDAMMLNGFSWAVSAADEPTTLGQMLAVITAAKATGGAARAMQYALDGIEKIWKPDAISNFRTVYGQTGGVMMLNSKRIAAKNAEVGNAIAEIVDPTNLGPNMAKLLASVKTLDAGVEKTRKELEVVTKNKEAAEARLKEATIFGNVVDQDIALRKAIVNDPEYQGLQKIIDLEAGIAEKRILREWYQNNIGLTTGYNGDLATDFSKAFKFMLGRRFAEIAEVVAKETDPVKVHRFFGKKLDSEMVGALTAAKNEDDVYRIFLSYLGNPTTDPKIFRSTTLRKEALALTANPVARLVNPVSYMSFRKAEQLDRMFSRYFVRSTALNLGDLNQTINGVEDWLSSAQIKSILGVKVQEKYIDDISRKLFASTSEQERAKIIQNGMDSIVDDLAKRFGADESTISELKDVIKLNAIQKNADTTYTNGKLSENGEVLIYNAGNDPIKIDGGIHFYQLAQGTMFLPDSKEVLKALNRYQGNALKSKVKAGKVLVEEMGDVWRTAQLVFRASYIIRNIAEMQMRQMFSGHANIITHPMQFISMMVANSGRGGKLAERFAKYQYDLGGNAFKNVDAEGEFLEAIRGYQMWAFRRASVSDYRTNKGSEVFKVYKVIGSGDKNFFEGLAHTLNRWGSDAFNPKIAKLMLNGDEAAKRRFVEDVINDFDKPNSDIRNYVLGIYDRNPGLKNVFLRDANVEADKITKADLSPEKIFTFFFDDAQEHTLAGQMRVIAGNGPKSHVIMDLLADGKATFTNNKGVKTTVTIPWFDGPLNSTQLSALETAFRKSLNNNFDANDLAGSRVLFEKQSLVGGPGKKEINNMVDAFFNLSSRLESKFNFGPEYQMAYWDFVGRYADMLSLDDLKYVRNQALKTLNPINIRVGNKVKTVGKKHATLRVIDSQIKKRLKNPDAPGGDAKWQTIHQMAAKNAGEYVKNLFYDASRQKQWAQAWRLVFPFAQAHTNTMYKWSQLAARNPIPLYRFSKAYDAATKEGSNVIYDIAGMSYDDDQGFIYKEPGMTEPMFKIPLVGNFLGAMAGKNLAMRDALQVTAPVQSLNLAFGAVNPLVPGLGPAAQILFTSSGKVDEFGPAWDIMRDIVTPFGAPDSPDDVVFPSWMRKTVLYAFGNDQMVQRGVKDWAAYLASSGEYGENPLASDETRNRLFRDAEQLSKSVGWMTALFQSISPATPMTEVLAKIKDPDNKHKFMTMTVLYEHWDRISKANPGDYGAAVRQFAETYGKNNILIALGSTTSAVRGTEDAWTWLNNNPDAANKYGTSPGDIVPYFFPGGEASVKYYNWQKRSGARRNLSTTELANEAEGLIYNMVKGQIAEEQIANGYPDFWYRQKIAELDKEFGGPPPDIVVTRTAQERIVRIGQALQDPAFAESPIYGQISAFYPQYMEFQTLLNQLNGANYAEIKSKSGMAPLLRDKLVSLAETLMAENPAFSRIYYGVFAGQLEG